MPVYKVKTFSKNFYSLKQGPSITDVTKVDVLIDWQAEARSNLWTEIIFVTQGEGRIMIGNNVYPMGKGDLIIINPEVIHYEEFRKKNPNDPPLCFYCCCMEDFETSMIQRNHLLPPHYQHIFKTGEMEEKFHLAFAEIFQENEAENEWYTDICRNLSYEIVMLTLRLLKEKYNLSLQWQNDKNVSQVRSFIDKHFTEKINTTIVAKELAMSRQSLYRLLKEGKFSPGKYIIQKRIELAKDLILNSDENLQNIAYKTGYSDYSSFFTVFKKTIGVSPIEYRHLFLLKKTASKEV